MKAIIYTAYGPPDVLQLQEIEKPSPKENEILVKVHASSINALEWRRFTLPRLMVQLMFEKSIGGDFAGSVEAVGPKVKQFRPGDEVFGVRKGAFAEYVCAFGDKVAPKPANVSFEAAAALPIAALTALQGLRNQGGIQSGHRVLINGAGGGVGTYAVQVAKSFGAEVTAVCGPLNLDIVRSLGADYVIDYTKEDVTKNRQHYDLILAVNGYHSIFDYRRSLKPNGTYVMAGGAGAQLIQGMAVAPFLSWFGKRKFRGVMANVNQKDLVFLAGLLEQRKVVSVIDRSYPLAEVAAAMKYVLKGHPRGKVVIQVA